MRVLYGIIVFFALFLLACSDAEREEKRLEGNLLMKGDSGVCYDGIGLTESYLVLLARGCDTIIQVFDKDDLSHLHAFALKGYGATYFSNPEFMKSNTKEPAGKDEFWIVDNQLTFNKMQVLADSLRFDRKYILIPELVPSTHYNVTTKEVYAVPIVEKNVYGPFCYANREEGIYWVEPPKVARTYRSCKHVAYLPNLCVNERQNSVVAALRFFNQIDFYDLKGVVETLLDTTGVTNYKFVPQKENPTYHPGRCADIYINGKLAGRLGQAHPQVVKNYNMDTDCYLAEISFDAVLEAAGESQTYKKLPKYPSVSRDIAVLVDDAVLSGDIVDTIKKSGGKLLDHVEFFDVYKGAQIPAGKKSMAYSAVFRADDRTLTDEEISKVMDKILHSLETNLGATLR